MTVLVTGAGGQVGHELIARSGHIPILGLNRSQLDIRDAAAVQRVITGKAITAVVNAAAYTAVDRAEQDAENAFAINRDAVGVLADACRIAGIPLFHISTDYVFDGEKQGAYNESDLPNPTGVYGQSKLEGEQILRERLDRHLILRVSWVFGAHGNNFVRTMLRLARERGEVKVVADQHGAPTPAAAIADALLKLVERHLSGQTIPWGTYHYTGTPCTTWHGFAEVIFHEAYRLGLLAHLPKLHSISTTDYPTPAKRPRNSHLDNTLAQAVLGLEPRDWRFGLNDVLKAWLTLLPTVNTG